MTNKKFTVQDGLAWLGISMEIYLESEHILRGRHGNPIIRALTDARDAQGTETTPEQVLTRQGIHLADPLAAVRAFARQRASQSCGRPWVAEIALCPRCGLDASQHPRRARFDS